MKPLGLVKVDALSEAISLFEKRFVRPFGSNVPLQGLRMLGFMATDVDELEIKRLTSSFKDGQYLFQYYLTQVGRNYYAKLPWGKLFEVEVFHEIELVNGYLKPGMHQLTLSRGGIIRQDHRWLILPKGRSIGAHIMWWHWMQIQENPPARFKEK